MGAVLLVGVIWAAILVPPAIRAHAARREAFLLSFDGGPSRVPRGPSHRWSQPVQRRRRIAGGLLVAMVATLLAGLLPTFRPLLVVHLFLVDSFLAYIALLAHAANRAARPAGAVVAAVAGPTSVSPDPAPPSTPDLDPAPGRRRAVPRLRLAGWST